MAEHVVLICLTLFGILIFQFYYYGKKQQKEFIEQEKREFGVIPTRNYAPGELLRIGRYFENHKHENKHHIDTITWNDLDMDRIFKMINRTYSSVGEEYLYNILRNPEMDSSILKERERVNRYFISHEKERGRMALLYHQIGRIKNHSLSDIWETIKQVPQGGMWKHYLILTATLASFGSIFLTPSVGVILFVLCFTISVISYYKEKAVTDLYVHGVRQIMGLLSFAGEMEKNSIPEISDYMDRLSKARQALLPITNYLKLMSGGEMKGSLLDSLMEYVRIITHIDLIAFQYVLKGLGKREKDVDTLFEVFGFLESMMAIASFRVAMSGHCIPEFLDRGCLELYAKDLIHPAIAFPVSNSVHLKRGMLLTGSNASGKSTFLKTVAINAILAQTIYIAMAKEFRFHHTHVMSSMALSDNLTGQESYYMVEIKSLKRILDVVNQGENVFVFIDEVLRGTNTVERIAASAQILKSLVRKHVLCFAATHDIELTYLLERYYENYHFREQIKQDIYFDYQLHRGRAGSKNAIALLGMIGYPNELIQKAKRCAEEFMTTGEWKMV